VPSLSFIALGGGKHEASFTRVGEGSCWISACASPVWSDRSDAVLNGKVRASVLRPNSEGCCWGSCERLHAPFSPRPTSQQVRLVLLSGAPLRGGSCKGSFLRQFVCGPFSTQRPLPPEDAGHSGTTTVLPARPQVSSSSQQRSLTRYHKSSLPPAVPVHSFFFFPPASRPENGLGCACCEDSISR